MSSSIAPAGGDPVSLLCANVVGAPAVVAAPATVAVSVVGVTVAAAVGVGVALEPDAFEEDEEEPHPPSVDTTAKQGNDSAIRISLTAAPSTDP
jgi:hypothetical protein